MKKKSGFSLFLGLRNFYTFRKGKKRTMLGAAITIALSLIPLIVVIEVSDGMIEGITRRFIELGTGHIQVNTIEKFTVDELSELSREYEEIPEIECAYPVYSGNGLIYSADVKTGIQIKAYPEDIMEMDHGFEEYLEMDEGEFDISDQNGIMLSSQIAEKLGVSVGSDVKLLTAKTAKNGRLLLRPETFHVNGLFSTGYYEIDALSGYINLKKGEILFKEQGYLRIQCKIEDPYNNSEEIALKISDESETDVITTSWFRINTSLYESLYTTKMVLILIMGVILIVASVNITSSMMIMVIERQSDIAILKSCGATNRQIRNSFIFTGLFTGTAGMIAGIISGLAISVNINSIIGFFQNVSSWFSRIYGGNSISILSASQYYLEEIPISVKPQEILAVASFAVLVSVLAAIIPALKAQKMMPIDIMRKH